MTGDTQMAIPEWDTLPRYQTSNQPGDSASIYLQYYQGRHGLQKARTKVASSKYFPEISIGYFNQEINQDDGLDGWFLGLSVPLWFFTPKAEVKVAKLKEEAALNTYRQQQLIRKQEKEKQLTELQSLKKRIGYFERNALKQANMLMETASLQLNKEEIAYEDYVESISSAMEIRLNYLEVLNEYNQKAIELENK